jgi:hypothetical protein
MHGIGWEKRICSSLDAVAAAGGYAARWNGGVADAGSAVELRGLEKRHEKGLQQLESVCGMAAVWLAATEQ